MAGMYVVRLFITVSVSITVMLKQLVGWSTNSEAVGFMVGLADRVAVFMLLTAVEADICMAENKYFTFYA